MFSRLKAALRSSRFLSFSRTRGLWSLHSNPHMITIFGLWLEEWHHQYKQQKWNAPHRVADLPLCDKTRSSDRNKDGFPTGTEEFSRFSLLCLYEKSTWMTLWENSGKIAWCVLYLNQRYRPSKESQTRTLPWGSVQIVWNRSRHRTEGNRTTWDTQESTHVMFPHRHAEASQEV